MDISDTTAVIWTPTTTTQYVTGVGKSQKDNYKSTVQPDIFYEKMLTVAHQNTTLHYHDIADTSAPKCTKAITASLNRQVPP